MERKSLKSRIAEANSQTEINALLDEGKSYDHASIKTIRKWIRTAAKRIEEINNV